MRFAVLALGVVLGASGCVWSSEASEPEVPRAGFGIAVAGWPIDG